jgi:hypothetical protein
MVQTVTLDKLSGSTDGKPIHVTGTATGTSVTVHTAVSGTSSFDRIFINAYNAHSADVVLTLEIGGASAPNVIKQTIPYQSGLYPVVPGGIIINNGTIVKAFAGTANVIALSGEVHEIV